LGHTIIDHNKQIITITGYVMNSKWNLCNSDNNKQLKLLNPITLSRTHIISTQYIKN